jgi:hypothetical protein
MFSSGEKPIHACLPTVDSQSLSLRACPHISLSELAKCCRLHIACDTHVMTHSFIYKHPNESLQAHAQLSAARPAQCAPASRAVPAV